MRRPAPLARFLYLPTLAFIVLAKVLSYRASLWFLLATLTPWAAAVALVARDPGEEPPNL